MLSKLWFQDDLSTENMLGEGGTRGSRIAKELSIGSDEVDDSKALSSDWVGMVSKMERESE